MIIFFTIFMSLSFQFKGKLLQNDSSVNNDHLSNNLSIISTTPHLSITHTPKSSSTLIPTLENTPIPPNSPYDIIDFHMSDAENGFVVGKSFVYGISLYKTNGLVKDWTILFQADPNFEETHNYKDMVMDVFGSKYVWFTMDVDLSNNLNEAVVRYSNDGGSTFNKSKSLPISIRNGSIKPVQIFFLNNRIGWLLNVVTDSQKNKYMNLYHTSDGGENWVIIYESPLINTCIEKWYWNKKKFIFVDENTGYLTGLCSDSHGNLLIYQTNDGGRSWQSNNLFEFALDITSRTPAKCEPDRFYQDLDQILHVSIICYNDSGFIQSYSFSRIENGKRWEKIISKRGIFFITNNKLLNPSEGRVSNNGGKDWIQLSEDVYYLSADNIQSLTDNLLFALRCDGTPCWMIKSTDGGDSWLDFSPFYE